MSQKAEMVDYQLENEQCLACWTPDSSVWDQVLVRVVLLGRALPAPPPITLMFKWAPGVTPHYGPAYHQRGLLILYINSNMCY